MSIDDGNDSSSESTGIAGLKGVTLLGSQPGQSGQGKVDRYYIQRRSGKVFGPFEKALIRQMVEGGKLSGDEGVSQDKQVWLPILSIPDFADLFDPDQQMTPRGVPTLSTDDPSPPPLGSENPFGPGTRATRPGLPAPEGENVEPNVHEEPTRAFTDSSIDIMMAVEPPLPSLADLPMPEALDFDVSDIPGLGEGSGSAGLPDLGSGAPLMPELPPAPAYDFAGPVEDDDDGLFGSRSPQLPRAPRPDAGPQLPAPKAASPAAAPRARPSLSRGRSDKAELPRVKTQASPELPTPKATMPPPGQGRGSITLTELPLLHSGSAPELPAVKQTEPLSLRSRPELPALKGAAPSGSRGAVPELPMPKGAREPELPGSKVGRALPELPMPKAATLPELPMPRDATRPELPLSKTGALPELPMPYGSRLPELPQPRRGQIPQLPLPRTGAELPVLADGLDMYGAVTGKLPELPTPKFGDAGLPTRSEDEDDVPFGLDDLFGPVVDEPIYPGNSSLGSLLGERRSASRAAARTFTGLDDDLLPPPTGDLGGDDDLLRGLGADGVLLDDVDFDLPGAPPTRASRAVDEAPTTILQPAAAGVSDRRGDAKARPDRARRTRVQAPSRMPVSRLALLGVLGIVLVGTALFALGVFDPSTEDGLERVGPTRTGPSGTQEVVVAPTDAVDLARLRPGNFGDYVGFLQPARAAVASANQNREAVARLLLGQSLMLAQYGERATLVEDMAARAQTLAGSDVPLHRLARGAYLATQGDVEGAAEALEGLENGERAPLAELFLGLAELERYQRARAAADAVALSAEPSPTVAPEGAREGTGVPPPAPVAEGTGAGSVVAARPLGAAVLDPAAEAHFARAVELDASLVPARYFLGLAARLRGDAPTARSAFEGALEVAPLHYPSLLALSELLLEDGQLEAASRHLVVVAEGSDTGGSDRERSAVHELLGRIARIQRDFEHAAQELERAYTADPTNHAALATLSSLLHETRQSERALAFLEEHAANRSAPEVVAAIARHQLDRAEDLHGAPREELLTGLVAELETARSAHPNDPRFPSLLGEIRLGQSLFDEAESLFEAALELDDQYGPAWVAMADLARLGNETAVAVQRLERAEQVGGLDAEIEMAIGDLYTRLDRSALAEAAYERAVRAEPFNMAARLQLARYEIERGDPHSLQRALEQLETAEGAGVDDPELNALFAEAQYGLGHLNLARERMNRVVDAQTELDDPAHVYLLGRINFDAGLLAEGANDTAAATRYYTSAREDFNSAYVRGLDSPDVRYWEARSMIELGDLERAIPILRRAIDEAIRQRSSHGAYQYWLGYCLEQQGQAQQALESYVLVDRDDLRWALENPDIFYRRGRLFSRTRLFGRAKRDLEWALILNPQQADAAQELAEVFVLERDYDRAIELWQRSLQIDPNQPRIHYRLGMTYLRLENSRESMRHLEIARDAGQGDTDATLYRTLGNLYREAGRNSDTVRELRRYLDSGTVAPGSHEENEIQQIIRRSGGQL